MIFQMENTHKTSSWNKIKSMHRHITLKLKENIENNKVLKATLEEKLQKNQ